MLRRIGKTRRGLSDDQLRIIARLYETLIAEGERYPVKALAEAQDVDKSTASRWVSAARRRGLLEVTP
jgi:DNA-binding MarR family transcriptional regulator